MKEHFLKSIFILTFLLISQNITAQEYSCEINRFFNDGKDSETINIVTNIADDKHAVFFTSVNLQVTLYMDFDDGEFNASLGVSRSQGYNIESSSFNYETITPPKYFQIFLRGTKFDGACTCELKK